MQQQNYGNPYLLHFIKGPGKQIQDSLAVKSSEQGLKNELAALKHELSFQYNLNNRLSLELSHCQERLGIQPMDARVMNEIPPTEISFLAPLFAAYDDKIKSMDEALGILLEDLKELQKKSFYLVEQNNFLRQQLQEKDEEILKLYKQGVPQESIQALFSKLEKEELNERIRLFQDENQFYIQKIKELENGSWELQDKLDAYERSEPKYLSQIRDLQEENKRFQLDLDDLKVRNEVLDGKLKNQINLAAFNNEEKSEYIQRVAILENENKKFRHSIQSMNQNLQELSENKDQATEELNKELDKSRNREREFFNRVGAMEREIDQVKDENRRLKKESDQHKSDLEQTIRMMESYENKIAISLKKEEAIIKVNKELKEKCEQAQLERDKLALKEQQFDQILQNQIAKFRDDMQLQKEQHEKSFEQYKQRSRSQIDSRDDEIARLNEEVTQAQLTSEKLQKEMRSLKAQLNRFENGLKQGIDNSNSEVDNLLRQVNELEERLQLQEQTQIDNEHSWTNEKQQLETQLKNVNNNNMDLRQNLDQTRSQLTSVTQELTTIKTKIQQLTRNNQTLIDEIAKTKKHYEQRLESLQDEQAYKIKNLQLQLEDAIKREKASRERAVQLLSQYDAIEQKLKAEYQARIQELEYQIQQLRSQIKILQVKLQEATDSKQQQQQDNKQYGTLRK